MRDRHIHISEHSDLLKLIYREVDKDGLTSRRQFRETIWTKFFLYSISSCTCYVGILNFQNIAIFMLSFVLYGFAIILLAFNFAHDFSHGTVFKKSILNDIGFIFIYAINGAHAEAWKKRHIESHHFAPNVEKYDSDLEISSLIRVIPQSQYIWYHRFQHLYAPIAYMTYSLYWIFIKDFAIYFSKNRNMTPACHVSFWTQKITYITYLVIVPILYSAQPWHIVIAGFVFMHLLQSLFLLFTFFMTHHVEGLEYPTTNAEGFINTSWVMNQIRSSNDMYPFSKLANFIFGGFNNHIAHHLFPQVHHIHYPNLNRILYDTLIRNGIIPNQTTYWGGVCSHFRLLKSMSRI